MMNKGKRIACFALAAAIVASSCLSAAAATENWNDASANTSVSDEWEAWKTEWQTVQNDYEKIALTVGKTESELNFSWYSHMQDNAPVVRLSSAQNMTGAIEFTGTQTEAKVLCKQGYGDRTEGKLCLLLYLCQQWDRKYSGEIYDRQFFKLLNALCRRPADWCLLRSDRE